MEVDELSLLKVPTCFSKLFLGRWKGARDGGIELYFCKFDCIGVHIINKYMQY
jgi:hypothetical protein